MPSFVPRTRGPAAVVGFAPTQTVQVVGDWTPPITLFVSDTRTRVSLVGGFSSTDVTWSANENCKAWEIREVSSSAAVHSDGTLLASGTEIVANVSQVTTIDGSLLSGGDGSKLLKIFAQDYQGNWTA